MSDSNDTGTGVAVGVSIGILAMIALGVAAFFVHRRRHSRGSTKPIDHSRRHTTTTVDPNHLAAQVTPFSPFSPNKEGPRFTHRPGENMRVARRRSDGGWDFSEAMSITPPTAPFINSMHSAQSSPTSSVYKKEKALPGELTTRGYVETDGEGIPPPAYSTSDGGISSMV